MGNLGVVTKCQVAGVIEGEFIGNKDSGKGLNGVLGCSELNAFDLCARHSREEIPCTFWLLFVSINKRCM